MVRVRATVATAILIAASAACGGDGSGNEGNQSSTLRLAVNTVPRGVDPHRGKSVSETPYVNMVYDTLTYVDGRRRIQPMLATSWEFSQDGTELVIELRDDVTFNDGTPLTADAVKASLDRGKALAGSTVAELLAPIQSVEVIDDHKVSVKVAPGAADLPAVFATPAGAVINPKVIASGAELHLNPPREAGSGAYVLESLRPNERATFVRADDDYWDPDAGKATRVEVTTVPDDEAKLAGFQRSAYDLLFIRRGIDRAKRLADQGEGKLYEQTAVTQFGLFFRNDRSEHFKNKALRQAINMLIDRQGLADQLMDGYCEPATQFWPKGDQLHVDELDGRYPYDPGAARRKLDEANAGGFSFDMIHDAGLWPPEDMTQIVQAELKDLGITAKVQSFEAAVGGPDYAAGKYDSYLDGLSGSPSSTLHIQTSLLGPPSNYIGQPPAELLDLLAKAKDQRLSEADRIAALRTLSTRITEDAWYAPICNAVSLHLAKDNVSGVDRMSWQWALLWEGRYLGLK